MSAENEFFRVIKETVNVSSVLEIHGREVCSHPGATILETTDSTVIVMVNDKAQLTIDGYEYLWDGEKKELIPFC